MKLAKAFDPKSERFFWLLAATLFAVLVIILYFPVFQGKIPLPGRLFTQFPAWGEFQHHESLQIVADIGDLIDYFYPFNTFSAQQIRHGTLPLWNPYVMAGIPFQAEPQTALFYPLHVLYYLFATPTAWSFALILRIWLAAMFMTLLVRSLGASKTGAIVSGIAFAFGGFMIAWQGSVMGDTMIWLPLTCYSVYRLHGSRSRASIALVAFAFAMPVLAGHPETDAHVILTAAAAALLIWAFPPEARRRFDMRFLLAFFLAGVLAIGLSAVQTLPTLEWIRQSSSRSLDAVWPSFDLHQAMGFFSRDILRGPNSAGVFVPNAVGYIGMLALLAAPLALLHPSRRYVVWFLGLAVVGISGTFGIEPVISILRHFPVINGLKNERLILLADFGLAALAGMGVSVLEGWVTTSGIRRTAAWLLLATAFILALVVVHKLQLATQFKVETLRRPSFSRTLTLASFAVMAWKLIRGPRAKLFSLTVCSLLAFDLLTFAYGYTGFTRRDEILPTPPVFAFLKQQDESGAFRIVRAGGWAYSTNAGIAYGLQSINGFEANIPDALGRFTWDFREDLQDAVSLVGEKVLATPDRRLDMLNVKYLVVVRSAPEYPMFSSHPERFIEVYNQGDIAVFENKTVLPRAFLVGASGVRVVADIAGQFQYLKDPSFDPLQTVVLSAPITELDESQNATATDFESHVETTDSNVNGYDFKVEASAPAILIVSQNFYPGWKATVDGVLAAVFAADHTLTGIAIPAGNHQVRFVFDPMTFKAGLALSVVSSLIFAWLVVSARKPDNRWPESAGSPGDQSSTMRL